MSQGHTGTEPTAADDARLVEGIRLGDSGALAEFASRFYPMLLDKARRLRIEPAERETVVGSFLCDIALRLGTVATPDALTPYVARSFRNHVRLAERRAALEKSHWTNHARDVGGVLVVAEACSAHTIRAVLGDDDGADDSDSVLNVLMNHLLQYLSETDRKLLISTSNGVSLREAAQWSGIGYGAARVRLSRVRARMRKEALRYLDTPQGDERASLERFLRRAAVCSDETTTLPRAIAGSA